MYLQFKHHFDKQLTVRLRQLTTLLQNFNELTTWYLVKMKLDKTIPKRS